MGDETLCVAADVTSLVGMRTGVGRSVEEMLRAVGATTSPPRVLPYVLGARPGRLRERVPPETRFAPLPARVLLRAWERSDYPRLGRWLAPAEVVHATSFVTPPTSIPTLVTIHDLSFVLHPGTVDAAAARFAPMLRRALARGVHVHTTTEQVASEVEEILMPGLRAAGRLHVVPFGIPALAPAGELPAQLRSASGSQPYVLALGQLGPRKNLETLIRALPLLAEEVDDVLLVLAGPAGAASAQLRAEIGELPLPLQARVLLLGVVDEPTRTALLQHALALAYPSRYEGFGFPLLEAMQLGTPVVCSDLPVFEEVTGGAALCVPVGDSEAFAHALGRVAADESLRTRQRTAGQARAAEFSWSRTGTELVGVYTCLAES